MKESTLVEMKNKVESLGQIVQMMHHELGNIKDLAVGTMELIKKFEGYEDAIEKLKADAIEQARVAGQSEGSDSGSKQEEVQSEGETQG